MSVRTTINSTCDQTDFLKRGFRSMFSNYGKETETTPPINTRPKNSEARPKKEI